MCYAIAVCNHTHQDTMLQPVMENSLQEATKRVQNLSKLYEANGENVTIVIYHMKYVVGFHPNGVSMEPIGSQSIPSCK